MMRRLAAIGVLIACSLSSATVARGIAIDYERQIKPILKSRCYACHGSLKQEGGLRVDTVAAIRVGGDSGPAVVATDLASNLLTRIKDTDESMRMPQEGTPLSPAEITLLENWVAAGALAPENDLPEPDPREHWSFKPPVRPNVPDFVDAGSEGTAPRIKIRNPIDAFVSQAHRQQGLAPVGEADKATLLRRVYFDLIGLPPTRAELHNFLADPASDAYEKLVDRLLASPQYGERWGRHWMDIWRYSDWYGRRKVPDIISSYPTIWRWRDWIVRSLNEDKGYDRMILEMLAADEIAPEDDQNLPATGFLVRNFYRWNYSQWMKDNVEHTAKAFLGLTLNCAHCHDHKYDPISQQEYFAFRAFFEPLGLRHDRVPGEPDPGKYKPYVYGEAYAPISGGMARVFDERLDATTRMYSRGDDRNVIEGSPPVEPRLPDILGLGSTSIETVVLPASAVYPGLKKFVVVEELASADKKIAGAQERLAAARAKFAVEEPRLIEACDKAKTELAHLPDAPPSPRDALAGSLSLFMDATRGRRTLSNPVPSVAKMRDGTKFSFQIRIFADAHANFQLALDVAKGSTAGLVVFERGRILTYRPKSFDLYEIARYDFAKGESRFLVTGTINVTRDLVSLQVINLDNQAELASAAEASLQGWNPAEKPKQGIVLDARPGSIVAFDEITFTQPDDSRQIKIDFEAPAYAAQFDAVGHDGWISMTQSAATSRSVVSDHNFAVAPATPAEQQLKSLEWALLALRLSVASAEAELAAAEKEKCSLQSRIAAGEAQYQSAADRSEKARRASADERGAMHARAVAEELSARQALAELEAKPAAPEEIAKAATQRSQLQQAVADASIAMQADREDFTLLTPTYPEKSTGRRSALARGIASDQNPLTARVAVNHLWARHFGQPLVETVFDFGRNGKQPTHPELLDWLAVELMEHGWSMKHVHRLIVNSSSYRLASRSPTDATGHQLDPQNRYLWRFPRHSVEAEVLRDSLLHVAGRLDLTMGGREIEQEAAANTRRRSMYISHHGESRDVFLETFNVASPNECYRRTESVVPQQALALVNGTVALESSRALAKTLWNELTSSGTLPTVTDADFIHAVYEQLLTRSPSPAEVEASLQFLTRQQELYRLQTAQATASGTAAASPTGDPAMRARESLVHALFNHHDFISIR